jgi:hypothetical protein
MITSGKFAGPERLRRTRADEGLGDWVIPVWRQLLLTDLNFSSIFLRFAASI